TQWYWRVRAAEGTAPAPSPAPVSERENFWLQPPSVPQLRYPADHARVDAGSPVGFAWEPLDAATSYELDVEGQAPVTATDSYAEVRELAPGKTRWRVRARLRDGGITEWSAARELTVNERAPSPALKPAEE